MKLNTLTLKEAIKKLKAKEISHKELYKDVFDAIGEKNKTLNAYLALDEKAIFDGTIYLRIWVSPIKTFIYVLN